MSEVLIPLVMGILVATPAYYLPERWRLPYAVCILYASLLVH